MSTSDARSSPQAAPDRPRPPTRAAGWVYGVVNPLLDTLETEIELLERGNVTFDCDSQRLRYMRSVVSYLSRSSQHNLSDFQDANPDARAPLLAHDESVDLLTRQAVGAYEALIDLPAFREDVRSLLAAVQPAAVAESSGLAAAPRLDPDAAVRALAEKVVNRRGALSEWDSVFAPLWNSQRARLLAFRTGDRFTELDASAARLLEADRALVAWLRAKRAALCEQFDIAAAPLGPAN